MRTKPRDEAQLSFDAELDPCRNVPNHPRRVNVGEGLCSRCGFTITGAAWRVRLECNCILLVDAGCAHFYEGRPMQQLPR